MPPVDIAGLNQIRQGDCLKSFAALESGCVDLAFADPPFNIGYDYDEYEDQLEDHQYLDWSREWMREVHRVLKNDGTFWLAIGDEYAAELKVIAREIGFHCRSWVIWYYTFGVNCQQKFSRSHAHLFYFVKDPAQFTFHGDDLDNRIPSARQLVYNDKRANPKGRLPDDTWIIRPVDAVADLHPDDQQTWTLRPHDLDSCFRPEEDTWYFPRVAGTFKERAGFHGCQMPEQLLGRIIRFCSSPGELVLDPFSGSATTLAVARKLSRNYLGFELSEDYVKRGEARLQEIRIGDPLDGSAEPTMSAPQTWSGKTARSPRNVEQTEQTAKNTLAVVLHGIREAYLATHQGHSIDRCLLDEDLQTAFHKHCEQLGLPGDPHTWNLLLLKLRQSGGLADVVLTQQTSLSIRDLDRILPACEIALTSLLGKHQLRTAEQVLCHPGLRQEFVQLAKSLQPGEKPFSYLWGSVLLSRQAAKVRERAEVLRYAHEDNLALGFSSPIPISDLPKTAPAEPALFVIEDHRTLFVGETTNLKACWKKWNWNTFAELTSTTPDNLALRFRSQTPELFGELAWQRVYADLWKTPWNLSQT